MMNIFIIFSLKVTIIYNYILALYDYFVSLVSHFTSVKKRYFVFSYSFMITPKLPCLRLVKA